jgi:predicted DNA-binding transcriptional regulator AlpA
MHPKTDNDPLILRPQARALLGGISRSTMRGWEANGRLPPPVRLSARVIGWRRSTIEGLLEKGAAR